MTTQNHKKIIMKKILYTSREVRGAIDQIFAAKHRRVAVVAYLGVNASKYLKSPKGIEIVCCPEPGATSPEVIRELLGKGADVKFSKQLHAKVYWSDTGCVITSANLSDNALGASKQKEAGILIDSKDVDIDKLLNEVKPYIVNQKYMDELDRGSRILNRQDVNAKSPKETDATFISWYESPYPERWKIGWWGNDYGEVDVAKSAKVKSSREYGVNDPENWIPVAKNQVQEGEWMLCFEITENNITNLEWLYVDFIVSVDKTDKKAYEKDYPYQAIQVHQSKHYPLPPFKIDPEFRKAFKKAVEEYGKDKIEGLNDLKPDEELLECVKKAYRRVAKE